MGNAIITRRSVGGDNAKVTFYSYGTSGNNLELSVYKGSVYKFQNMSSEVEVTEACKVVSIPCPATGYIKMQNITIS